MKRNSELNKTIPPGKLVKIFTGALNDEREDPIETLMLKDSFTLPIQAEYASLNNSASFTQSVVSQLIGRMFSGTASEIAQGLVSGLNGKLGFQTYSSPKPVTITLNCSLMAITNAWRDVVNPVRKIQSLLLPRTGWGGFLTDYPGVDPVMVLKGSSSSSSYKDASVMVGNIGFNHVIFKNADATFSTEVDQTGYPIGADLSLTFETSFFATVEMLNEEIYGCTEEGLSLRDTSMNSALDTFRDTVKNSGLPRIGGLF